MNIYPFTFKDHTGEVGDNFWIMSSTITWDGVSLEKKDKKDKFWTSPQGNRIEISREKLVLPKLIVDGEQVILVTFTKLEWFLILFPFFLIVIGGAVPAVFGAFLINNNLKIFRDQKRSSWSKAFISIGLAVVAFIILMVLAAVLQG